MLHIYRQITALKRCVPVVIAQKREQTQRFPFEPVQIVPKPATHFVRRFLFRQVRNMPWQISDAELRALLHLLSRTDARLLHIYFGQIAVHLLPLIRAWKNPSIVSFLETAEALNSVPMAVRGNALGIFQANIGIWQILARQGEIPGSRLNDSWQQAIKPFARIRSGAHLFNAGRLSLVEVLRASTAETGVSQDEIIELLAGPQQTSTQGKKMHAELALRIRSVLEEELHQLHIYRTAGAGLCRKTRAADVAGSDSGCDEKRCESHVVDVGIGAFVQERSNHFRIAGHGGAQ